VAVERERLDSKLEAEGAEFLMLAHLILDGIQATKAYTNHPGYDLLAVDPETDHVCRIQVKSRWATDYDRAFPIKNVDCDFVVHVALNRGHRGYRRKATAADCGGDRRSSTCCPSTSSSPRSGRPAPRACALWQAVGATCKCSRTTCRRQLPAGELAARGLVSGH
jgi:hypothetical protein